MATILDIARETGMAKSSVAQILQGRPGYSPASRQRILEIADRLGYRPSRQARQLRHRSTMTLAVQVDSGIASNNVWRATVALNVVTLDGVGAFAGTRGYQVNWLSSRAGDALEDLRRQVLREQSVDGVVFMGYRKLQARDAAELVRRMRAAGVAAVSMDETLGAAGMPTVTVNLEPAVHQAVDRLRELGCRRVAYIGRVNQIVNERVARFELFREALIRSGIQLPDELVIPTLRELDGYRHTHELIKRGPLPDCIIYGADHLAMAGVSALGDNAINIPGDVRILSVDHAPYAAESPVPLASIDYRFYDHGQTLAKVLLDQIINPKASVPARTELRALFVDGPSLSGGVPVKQPDRYSLQRSFL